MKLSSPAPPVLVGLFGVGVVAGGVSWLNSRHEPLRPAGEVALANTIHVLLALLAAAVLVVAAHRDPARLRRFLAWPFTIDGWRALVFATVAIPLSLWRLLTVLARGRIRRRDAVSLPIAVVLLAAAVNIWYIPYRDGVQVLAGLNTNFTSDAWGGPSYLGAALAHWLDGLLIFYAAAVVVQVLTRNRSVTYPPRQESPSLGGDGERHL